MIGMVLFALEGGAYGTRDLLAMKQQVSLERERIATLRHDVDSLNDFARALRTDPVMQERIAREQFGMIRPGEVLFQVVRPDSTR